MSQRALFIGPDMRTGGAERHWISLLLGLIERGIAVRLLCLQRRGSLYDQVVQAGIPARVLEPGAPVRWATSLIGELRGRPDVIVTRGFNGHATGCLLGRLSGAVHVLNWHRQPGRPVTTQQRRILTACARAGDHVISVTTAQEDELLRVGFRKDQLHVIHNGVPGLPATTGIGTDGLRALLVANLRPEKRIDRFIEAIALAQARAPEIMGLICGDGPERAALEARAEALGARVEFLGHRHDVGEVLAGADALCLTSEAEALPMVILEAMAAGLPVVATHVGGVGEAVDDGVTGFLVPVDDPEATADRLIGFARDRETAASMGRAGRARYLDAFSLEVMIDRYAGVLEELSA